MDFLVDDGSYLWNDFECTDPDNFVCSRPCSISTQSTGSDSILPVSVVVVPVLLLIGLVVTVLILLKKVAEVRKINEQFNILEKGDW